MLVTLLYLIASILALGGNLSQRRKGRKETAVFFFAALAPLREIFLLFSDYLVQPMEKCQLSQHLPLNVTAATP